MNTQTSAELFEMDQNSERRDGRERPASKRLLFPRTTLIAAAAMLDACATELEHKAVGYGAEQMSSIANRLRQLVHDADLGTIFETASMRATISRERLLEAFDLSVAGVHLLNSPHPDYSSYDKAEWHTRGILQGLKIARVILEENLKLLSDAQEEVR